MSTDRLFAVPEPIVPEPFEELSAGQRLTRANNTLLEHLRHPATRQPLANNGHTCGDCEHHTTQSNGRTNWHKCDRHRLGQSNSAHSDIRVGWPACTLWQPEPEEAA